jgi:hypothetical protein
LWEELLLEHAEHDRADKGECDIRGNNAQSADEGHRKSPVVHAAARANAEASKPFPEKKSALLHYCDFSPVQTASAKLPPRRTPATWLKVRKINALKSP